MNATRTSRTLGIAPRAATLAIQADPLLESDYRVDWAGIRPRVRESGDAIDIGYTARARLRALSPRPGSLTVALNPNVGWAVELARGIAGLRADLCELQISGIVISGGASDVVVDLPRPRAQLPLRIEGGVSSVLVRRPADTPVVLEIDGGASELKIDDTDLGAVGGVVRRRTRGEVGRGSEVAIQVLGGASRLSIETHDRLST
jgi:hypothetical protein